MSVIKSFQQTSIEVGVKIELHLIESHEIDEVPKDYPDPEAFIQKKNKHWEVIKNANAIFVPGGFGFRGVAGKMEVIKYARENKKPFFGICYGFQLAVVEFCRNVLNWNAISEEYSDEYPKTPNIKKVICFMPEVRKDFLGGTMRLGLKRALIE